MKFFPPYPDEGEVIAAWGEAKLVKYLDGKPELKGSTRQPGYGAGGGLKVILAKNQVNQEESVSGSREASMR